jgi:hypothetical protein
VLAVLLGLVFLPGDVLVRSLARTLPAAARVPLSFLAGLSLACAAAWACGLAGLSFSAYAAVLQVASAGVLAAGLTERRREARAEPTAGAAGIERSRLESAALFLAAAALSVYFVASPARIRPDGDAFVHIGLVRTMIADDTLSPGDPLAPPVYAKAGPATSDPRTGALHPFLAAAASLARVDALDLWRALPAAAAPMGFLAFGVFAAALLPGSGYVAFSLALFLMFQGGIGREFFGAIAYGQHLALVFYWLSIVLALRYAREGGAGALVLASLLVFGGALIHVDVLIHWALALAGILVFQRAFGFTPRRAIVFCAVTASCAAVVGAWRLAATYAGGNVLHTHPQGLLYFFDIGDRFFVPSPAEIVRKNGLLFFAALFLVPFLLLVKRHRRFALMSLALSLPPLVTALNPLACPPLYGKIHYLVHRFLLNVPAFVVTALVLGSLLGWALRGGLRRKAVCAALLFLWARVFLVAAGGWAADLRAAGKAGADVLSAEMADAARFVNERIPAKSVVLSDPATGYALSAFTHARVVAVLGQHGNPNDRYPLERLAAVHTVMSPYTFQIETVAAIRRFAVEYVVVNGSFDSPYHAFLADWDPAFKAHIEGKLGSLDAVFSRVYENGKVAIYRVENGSFDRVTWEPLPPYLDAPRFAVEPCSSASTTGEPEASSGAAVAAMGVEPWEALPGETVRVGVGYGGGGHPGYSFPLTLRLRFDDRRYFETARRFPGDKYLRRFRERRENVFRRFRVDHEPFGGYVRVSEWPPGRNCYEEIEVRLPRSLGEAVYDVRWQLAEETILPNFAVRDFLFNEDSYAGSRCAEISVRKQIVR